MPASDVVVDSTIPSMFLASRFSDFRPSGHFPLLLELGPKEEFFLRTARINRPSVTAPRWDFASIVAQISH